jgi:tetratricopeptide (TPR) repeat protein
MELKANEYFQAGLNAKKRKNYQEAYENFKKAIQFDSTQLEFYISLGDSALELAKIKTMPFNEKFDLIKESRQAYYQVLQNEPENTLALMGLSRGCFEMRTPDLAIAPLINVLKKNPQAIDAWELLANAYIQMKNILDGIRCYMKMADLRPDDLSLKQILQNMQKKYKREYDISLALPKLTSVTDLPVSEAPDYQDLLKEFNQITQKMVKTFGQSNKSESKLNKKIQ